MSTLKDYFVKKNKNYMTILNDEVHNQKLL